MSRGDEADSTGLRERLAALEQRIDTVKSVLETATNRDIPLLKRTVRSIVDADIETIEELPPAGRAFGLLLLSKVAGEEHIVVLFGALHILALFNLIAIEDGNQ